MPIVYHNLLHNNKNNIISALFLTEKLCNTKSGLYTCQSRSAASLRACPPPPQKKRNSKVICRNSANITCTELSFQLTLAGCDIYIYMSYLVHN